MHEYITLTEDILAPAAGEAAREVEHLTGVGQADDVDVVDDVDGLAEQQKTEVVVQSARVESLVDDDLGDLTVLVGEDLVLGLRVPFAGANLQH